MSTRLAVKGMSCGHCTEAVRTALAGVPGVTRVVDVTLEPGAAEVEGTADPAALVKAVEAEGYDATVI